LQGLNGFEHLYEYNLGRKIGQEKIRRNYDLSTKDMYGNDPLH
jgi:hypothetical protein